MFLKRYREETLLGAFHAHGRGWLGLLLAGYLSLLSNKSAVPLPAHISESLHASPVLCHRG